ncbi:MAG: permease [Parachlamydiales bacterium]|jgi:hypothetical protein
MSLFYPFKLFSEWLAYQVLRLPSESLLGQALAFFVYDVLKIFSLLYLLIFFVALIRSYLSKEKIQRTLAHKRLFLGYLSASFLGVLTPFCSCSAIPFFLSFLEAGIPSGLAFTFLIASPMVNEVALILLMGLFGFKIACIYILSGLAISLAAGYLIGKTGFKWIAKDLLFQNTPTSGSCGCQKTKTRFQQARQYASSIFKKIWLYVVIGIGLGAWIHGYVPDDFLAKYADASKWYAVPLATLIGIPLYSNAAGTIPLVSALVGKGLKIGTALAFMMAVTALSLPEFLILKRIMNLKLLLLLAAIVGSGIILIGYLFNFLL